MKHMKQGLERPKRQALFAAAALALLALPPWADPVQGEDWPQWRGPNRDGISRETGLLSQWPEEGPPVVWRVPGGEGFSSVSVAGGRAFTMAASGEDEFALCLDAATGKQLWKRRLGEKFTEGHGNGPRSTPTVEGDRVFILGSRGMLTALNAGNGETVWASDLREVLGSGLPPWGFAASPLVEGELLIIQGGKGGFHCIAAFDKLTGAVAWTSHKDGGDYSSPIAVTARGARQVLSLTEHALVSLAPASGELNWSYPFKENLNIATPLLVPPDQVFISAAYDKGAALVEMTGEPGSLGVEEVWFRREMKNLFSSSVLHDGHIYGFDNAILKCISAATGETRWRQRGFSNGSLILADGHLIVLGGEGELALVEAVPDSCRRKAGFQVVTGKCWTAPALADGRLLLRNQEEIVCLDLSDGG